MTKCEKCNFEMCKYKDSVFYYNLFSGEHFNVTGCKNGILRVKTMENKDD